MPQLNIAVDDATYQAAKEGCEAAGMKLRIWVSRAILEKRTREQPVTDDLDGDGK